LHVGGSYHILIQTLAIGDQHPEALVLLDQHQHHLEEEEGTAVGEEEPTGGDHERDIPDLEQLSQPSHK